MSDKLTKCPACSGRGYHNCACWPGDCTCGYGDETCEECGGDGFIEPGDEQGCYWPEDDQPAPPPQPNRHADRAAGHAMGWRQAVDTAVYRTNNALCDLIVKDVCDPAQVADKVIEALTSLYSDASSPQDHKMGTLTPQMIRDTAGWEQMEDELRVTLRQAATELEAAQAERNALRAALKNAADQLALVHDDAFKQAAGYGLITSDGREFSCYQLNICQTAAGKARAALTTEGQP